MYRFRRLCLRGVFIFVALAGTALPQATTNIYLQHNLVADVAGQADFTDPGLVNPWGIAISGTSPFWVNDAGTGLSTIYTSTGSPATLKVTVPAAAKGTGTGSPTGIVFNGSQAFAVQPGKFPNFVFATFDGTISGWSSTADATHAIVMVDNSASGAVYTGLAIGGTASAPMLYAANFNSGKVDVFDANYAPVTLSNAFGDPAVPAGFAPFNIQNLGGKLYVTYAKQDAAKKFDVPGAGNGVVDIYDMSGVLLQHVTSGGPLNSPWGVAIAPANFGMFSNDLLVGNFGDGTINAFDPKTGAALGTLQDANGKTISINGLWGLQPGNGRNGGDTNAVYFAAGTGGQRHGLFGSIQAAPVLTAADVVNAASYKPVLAQNTWITLVGSNLAATTRGWATKDFTNGKLPTSLDGVSVTINGKPAYVGYVSPTQINVLSAVDATQGPVQLTMLNNGLTSGSMTVQLQPTAPAFFLFKNDKYIAATHSDNVSLVGPTTLYPNASTPAKPGETIVLYGTGFGATTPAIPDGQLITTAIPLAGDVVVQFGGTNAKVVSAVLSMPGLYQLNVVVPDTTPDGDIPVTAQVGSVKSADGALITVQK